MKKLYLLALIACSCGDVTAQPASGKFKDPRINGFQLAVSIDSQTNSFSYLQDGSFINNAPVDYLKKSKNQKIWAWILTGVGAGIVTVGLLTEPYVEGLSSSADEKNSVSPAVYAVGGGFIAGGIILFTASSRNKKKGMRSSAILKIEKNYGFASALATSDIYPAAGIKISLP